MQLPSLDLATGAAIFNITAGLATIWLSQCITRQAGTKSIHAWLKGIQRAILLIIAFALIANGGLTIDNETAPRPIDMLLEAALLLPLLLFAVRYIITPQINAEVRAYQNDEEHEVYNALWATWARLSLVGLVVTIGVAALLWVVAPGRPVSVYRDAELLTPTLPVGGDFKYRITVNRLRPCPGYVADFFTTKNKTLPGGYQAIANTRRPLATTRVQNDLKLDISVSSPRPIVGPAHYRSMLVSNCPEGERTDPIAEFDFETVVQ